MTTERPAPPVTVRDPARVRDRGEVLETRDRLSGSRNRWLAAGLALVLLLGLLAVRSSGARRDQRGLAGSATLLVVGATSTRASPRSGRYERAAARLELRNPGPGSVELASAAVDGWTVSVEAGALQPGGQTTLRLSTSLDCQALPRPAAVTVRLRVPGGGRVTRRLPVVAADLLPDAQEACGQLPPAAALDVGHSSAVVVGDALELDLDVLDRTTTPLRLLSVSGDGARVEVRPGLPLLLPGRVPGRVPTTRALHLRVSVAACRDAVGSFFGPGLTRVHLEAASGATGLSELDVSPSADFRDLLAALVQRACRRT